MRSSFLIQFFCFVLTMPLVACTDDATTGGADSAADAMSPGVPSSVPITGESTGENPFPANGTKDGENAEENDATEESEATENPNLINTEGEDFDGECQTIADCSSTNLPPCKAVQCLNNMCVTVPGNDGLPCDDGNACTENTLCDLANGGCIGGTEIECPDDGNPCTVGTCNSQAGGCISSPIIVETACDDGDPCTLNDQCKAGVCEAGTLSDDESCQGAGGATGGAENCPAGTVLDCDGVCRESEYIGDGSCDDGTGGGGNFNCEAFNFDEGDCEDGTTGGVGDCVGDQVLDCDQKCGAPQFIGDGTCDDGTANSNNFFCEEFDFDEGDCDGGTTGGGMTTGGGGSDSCVGKCGASWVIEPGLNCGCDTDCYLFGSCCDDFEEVCQGEFFPCSDGTLIDPSWECDGFDDCYDGSDEADCEWDPDEYFICETSEGEGQEVYPLNYECDEYEDCADGSDEANCGAGDEEGDEDPTGGDDCPDGKIPDCDGTCASENWLGDGDCDKGAGIIPGDFNCEEFNFDEGDCEEPTTGGGEVCPDGQVPDCNGECYNSSFIGNGFCDDGTDLFATDFDCAEFNFDEGDCEESTTGGDESCSPGYIPDCDGACYPEDYPGDGTCDDGRGFGAGNFNCEEFNFDGEDCICPLSFEIADCNQECHPNDYVGDDQCDNGEFDTNSTADFDCEKFNFDEGDCQCGVGDVLDCNGYCHPASSINDNICDDDIGFFGGPNFNCEAFNFDEGDCICPSSNQVADCNQECQFVSYLGDGQCNNGEFGANSTADFNCAELNFDEGDCQCEEGEVLDCNGYCHPESFINNNTCDDGDGWGGPDFDCAEFELDGGDCICSISGYIPDCNEECNNSQWVGDGICDDGTDNWGNFNCEEFNFDEGDCDDGTTGGTGGTGGTCNGITNAVSGDGCCLPGYNLLSDSDCICASNEYQGCPGYDECVNFSSFGDGICDASLNCPGNYNDNGDCQ